MENGLTLFEGQSIHELDKAQRKDLARIVVSRVREGEIDPLDVLQSIKAWEDIFEKVTKDGVFYKELLDAMDLHGKSAVLNGNTLTQAEAGVQYDYSTCNDPLYAQLEADFKAAEAKLKERQGYLKKVPVSGQDCLNKETGELHTIYPPYKTSKSIIKVQLK